MFYTNYTGQISGHQLSDQVYADIHPCITQLCHITWNYFATSEIGLTKQTLYTVSLYSDVIVKIKG